MKNRSFLLLPSDCMATCFCVVGATLTFKGPCGKRFGGNEPGLALGLREFPIPILHACSELSPNTVNHAVVQLECHDQAESKLLNLPDLAPTSQERHCPYLGGARMWAVAACRLWLGRWQLFRRVEGGPMCRNNVERPYLGSFMRVKRLRSVLNQQHRSTIRW